ncbi:hypothetical protein AALP_AAs47157U000400 [Arabis alpina]|uniref:Protein MIS12 homolog n=1 Tax=Arabis alpina TaxID=50452 RepID=A0A087G329_ARAAL|nr:hypothetical protein AALP_AAs47157U000400 [Arabis alpina]
MEGSKSEAVFDSMNLNPQLFINETFNTIDDIFEEAFDFYTSEASTLVKIHGSDKSIELSNGIERVRGMIQSALDNRLQMWQVFCIHHSFAVPHGFLLPNTDESSLYDDQDGSKDMELDAELDSLRNKLNLVGKRSAELSSELRALERTSFSSEQSARLVNEALKVYDESSVDEMFKEMAKMVPELRAGMNKLKTRRKEFTPTTSDRKLEDLEKFMAELRKM